MTDAELRALADGVREYTCSRPARTPSALLAAGVLALLDRVQRLEAAMPAEEEREMMERAAEAFVRSEASRASHGFCRYLDRLLAATKRGGE